MANTDLLQEFYETGKLPAIDFLLDWRSHLIELRKKATNKEYYDLEIAATEFLLAMYK